METEEVIKLLRTYKENKSKLRLKENEKKRKEAKLRELEEAEYEISMSPRYCEGSKSTTVNSKVENIVVNKDARTEELKHEIKQLSEEIESIRIKIDEVDIRLDSLTYFEKEILIERFINEKKLEDIGQETCWRIIRQTRERKAVSRIIDVALCKVAKI